MGQSQIKINSLIEYYRKRYKQLNDISKSNEPYVIMSTFVVTANTLNKVDDLLDALHLWLYALIISTNLSHILLLILLKT